jgi:hypothetical protein
VSIDPSARSEYGLIPCSLDGAHLEVTSTTPVAPAAAGALPTGADSETPIGAASTLGPDGVSHLEQEDKPKAGIMAECEFMSG